MSLQILFETAPTPSTARMLQPNLLREMQLLARRLGLRWVEWGPGEAGVEFCPGGTLYVAQTAGGLRGSAQSSAAGPGFHKAAADFLLTYSRQAWVELRVQDETGFWELRDFGALRQQFFTWLRDMLYTLTQVQPGASGIHVNFPTDAWYPARREGICTPLGVLSAAEVPALLAAPSVSALAQQFFVWPNVERDALYHRNAALWLLWNDCTWTAPRTPLERTLADAALAHLDAARRLDPLLPLPLAAWSELAALMEMPSPSGCVPPDLPLSEPIGYRRGDLLIPFPHDWVARLPGRFLFAETDKGPIYWDLDRTFRLVPMPRQQVLQDDSGGLDAFFAGWQTLPRMDACRTFYQIHPPNASPASHWILTGAVVDADTIAMVAAAWKDPLDEQWAVQALSSVRRLRTAPG